MKPPSSSGKSRFSALRRALGKGDTAPGAPVVSAPAPSEQANEVDALTGLPNEQGFRRQLLAETGKRRYSGETLFVAYLDLNGLKWINDNLGHDAGDVMLKGAGDAPRYGILREGECFAHLHGDEYAGFFYAKDYDGVLERGETLRDAMFEGVRFRIEESSELFGIAATHPSKEAVVLATARERFSVAIGFAAVAKPSKDATPESLMLDAIGRADKEMYRHKQVHHLIGAEDAWKVAVRNLHAFDTQRFETVTDWLDDRESGLSLDTRTELTIMLKKRDDLRWKVGTETIRVREPWLLEVVPSLADPAFRIPPALYLDAAVLTELRTRLGIRRGEQRLPDFESRPNAGQVERLQQAMDAMAAFDYVRAPHGVSGYGKPSALVRSIPRPPGPLAQAVQTAEVSATR